MISLFSLIPLFPFIFKPSLIAAYAEMVRLDCSFSAFMASVEQDAGPSPSGPTSPVSPSVEFYEAFGLARCELPIFSSDRFLIETCVPRRTFIPVGLRTSPFLSFHTLFVSEIMGRDYPRLAFQSSPIHMDHFNPSQVSLFCFSWYISRNFFPRVSFVNAMPC